MVSGCKRIHKQERTFLGFQRFLWSCEGPKSNLSSHKHTNTHTHTHTHTHTNTHTHTHTNTHTHTHGNFINGVTIPEIAYTLHPRKIKVFSIILLAE